MNITPAMYSIKVSASIRKTNIIKFFKIAGDTGRNISLSERKYRHISPNP